MKDSSQTVHNGQPRVNLSPNDPGYYYDPNVEAGQHGEVRLSPVVQ